MRAKLGLKPLKMGGSGAADKAKDEHRRGRELAEGREKAKEAESIKEKLRLMREKREHEAKLKATKGLADEDSDEDDIAAWVQKSRVKQSTAPAPKKTPPASVPRKKRASEADEDADADGGAYASEQLAGMKVKHGVNDIVEGETAILTLEDTSILDDKGNLKDGDDALVDLLKQEDKKRLEARRAAKGKVATGGVGMSYNPDFDEEPRGLLAHYDEPGRDDDGMEIDADGGVAAAERQREEMRAKLKQAAAQQSAAVEVGDAGASADYYTKEELEKFAEIRNRRKKKKKDRKLRKKDGDTSDLVAELAQEAGEAPGADLGSRADRERRMQAREREAEEEKAAKERRYARALEKANYASLALKPSMGEDVVGADEDELYASIAEQRAQALKKRSGKAVGEDAVRELVGSRRDDEGPAGEAGGRKGELVFSSAVEFVNGIDVGASAATDKPGDEAGPSGVREEEDVEMEEAGGEGEKREGKGRSFRKKETEADGGPQTEAAGIGEGKLGRGLGAALGMLRDTGGLKQKVEWSGRTNDTRKDRVLMAEAARAMLGDGSGDQTDERIETALRKLDEFGRVLTPKEAWRKLCHEFHGYGSGKKKLERRTEKVVEELRARKIATGVNADKSTAAMRIAAEKTSAPYVLLQGRGIAPSQVTDGSSKYAMLSEDAPGGAATGRQTAAGKRTSSSLNPNAKRARK
ncbi:unnamed protein product [Pedinophyceae sp. YPF-701]|nr:unnamed protein product [Pedinophyceae sp. YPF-701]